MADNVMQQQGALPPGTGGAAVLWRLIGALTRRVQTFQKQRSMPGYGRLSSLLRRVLPPYRGVIQLSNGVRMHVDTAVSAERWLMLSGTYHPALGNLLQQHVPAGGYCIDAGANLGFFTVQLAHWVGQSGRVAAFEPNPAMVARIRQNVAANAFTQVDVVPKALHDQSGVIQFYVDQDPAKSSLDSTVVRHPADVISAEAMTLADYVSSAGWTRLDAIKMDIEGNDCRALLAAEAVLERFRPFIVFEYKHDTDPTIAGPAFAMFTRLGYGLEALAFDGNRFPFDWRQPPPGYKQVDVLCFHSA